MPQEAQFEWENPEATGLATGTESLQDWMHTFISEEILPGLGDDYNFFGQDWEDWWEDWGETVESFEYDPAEEMLSLRGTSEAYKPLRSATTREIRSEIGSVGKLGFGGRGYAAGAMGETLLNFERDVGETAYLGRTDVKNIWSNWYENKLFGELVPELTTQGAFEPDVFTETVEEVGLGCFNENNQSISCPPGCADGSIVIGGVCYDDSDDGGGGGGVGDDDCAFDCSVLDMVCVDGTCVEPIGNPCEPWPTCNWDTSDIRLKKNITKVGISKAGINVYEFDYIYKPGRYRGVMAQEVPNASAKGEHGYYMVDYSKIDVNFERIN